MGSGESGEFVGDAWVSTQRWLEDTGEDSRRRGMPWAEGDGSPSWGAAAK